MLLLALVGCAPVYPEPSCDPRILNAGEVRARRLSCSDDLLSDGEGRRSDWVIESAAARFVIRDTPDALTRLSIAGGTIVDAAATDGSDPLVEAVPSIGGQWMASGVITRWSEADAAGLDIDGLLPDGTPVQVRYTLPADSATLRIAGIDALTVTPRPGTERVGSALEYRADGLLGVDGVVSDAGGAVRFDGATMLTVGSRAFVHDALWPDGAETSGEASGTWAEAVGGGEVLARYPILSASYSGRLPPETESIRAVQEGALDGPEVAPGSSTAVGASGSVRLRVTDGAGGLHPATLYWDGTPYPTLPGGVAQTGPGEGTAIIYAGPGFELMEVDLTVEEEVTVNVNLPWAVTPAVLADLALLTAPDASERRDDDDILDEAAAAGVGFAVLVARDEVSSASPGASSHVFARAGSQSNGIGQPVAWSWSPSSKPAHGAAPWEGLSAEDLLSVMARRDGRTTIVGTDWLTEAAAPLSWLPAPDMVRVTGLADLDTLIALYDRWLALPPVGPLTWVEGLEAYAAVDVEAMLQDGRTIATTGPRIVLTVDGEGPGAFLEPDGPVSLSLQIEAPSWMPLSGASLIGSGGEVLDTWSLSGTEPIRLTKEYLLNEPPDWVLAICWGEDTAPPYLNEPAWAITAPIWLARP
ncbi:MAG: hypothetical protein P8R54_29715 [Myxococcota bacterium]|nr:hypothetical protein [Myxococcota bacterium]